MPNRVNFDQFCLVRHGATLIKLTWHLVRLSRTIRQRPLEWVDPVRLIKPVSVEPHRISHLMNECIQMHEIKKKIFQSQYYAHSSSWFVTAQHDKSFVLIKQKRRSKSNLSRTQISIVRRGAARLIKRALHHFNILLSNLGALLTHLTSLYTSGI